MHIELTDTVDWMCKKERGKQMGYYQEKEIREAIAEGQTALSYLQNAKELLGSAGNWGLLDLFGGGMFSTFMKHSKMSKAEQQIQLAKDAIKRFQRELLDVDYESDFHIETGDLLSFADYFFDGLIADWLVQARISDAKKQVDIAIRNIQTILAQLNRLPY